MRLFSVQAKALGPDEEIEGVFYVKELQKVHKIDDIYTIEKILAEKQENGKVKVFV